MVRGCCPSRRELLQNLGAGNVRKRWILFLIIGASFDGLGYQGPIGVVLGEFFFALSAWFAGFDYARIGRSHPLEDVVTHEWERRTLFVLSALSALLMLAPSVVAERAGAASLYVFIGIIIARQGFRLGGRSLSARDWADEIKFGALRNLAVMCLVIGVIDVLGQLPDVTELVLLIAPIGVMAISDEPMYLSTGPYVRRYFKRQHRMRVLGLPDNTW